MTKHSTIRFKGLLTALCLLVFMAGTAGAITYEITAGATDLTMPDGTVVPVWGYAITASGPGGTPADGVVKVPGDPLVVPAGDNQLEIILTNNLPEETSLHILGQTLSNNTGPVFPVGDLRVRSFSHETPTGGTGTYQWNDFKPGTWMLQSATNPARQVQMGLYAAVKKDTVADAEAYPGIPYDQELILVFHDIDPFLHAAIAGTVPEPYLSSAYHQPRFYLINGKSYPDIPDPVFTANIGQRLLIRFVNAGLVTHVPQILGMYMTTVAEDGIPYTYTAEQYGVEMPPAKTLDAILVPAKAGPVAGKFPIYDGRLGLSNFGTYQGTPPGGGMLAYLAVQAAGGVTAVDDPYSTDEDVVLVVAAPGVLANDTPLPGLTATLETGAAAGAVVLSSDGSFTYTPNTDFNGQDTFSYRASDGAGSDLATVTITVTAVNDLPIAVDDPAETITTTPVTIDVLANDTDADGDPLTVSIQTQPTNGTAEVNADETVTYTAAGGFTGEDTFTYTANDGTGDSNAATVTITVNEEPANQAPVAVDDYATVVRNSSFNLINVVTNDYDPDGTIDTTTVAIVQAPAHGTINSVAASGVVTYTPDAKFKGTDSFTYTVEDNDGAPSNEARVLIEVVIK